MYMKELQAYSYLVSLIRYWIVPIIFPPSFLSHYCININ